MTHTLAALLLHLHLQIWQVPMKLRQVIIIINILSIEAESSIHLPNPLTCLSNPAININIKHKTIGLCPILLPSERTQPRTE